VTWSIQYTVALLSCGRVQPETCGWQQWVSHDATTKLSCTYTAKLQQHRARATRECLSDAWFMSSLWLLCTLTAELPAIMSADYQGEFRSAYLLT
jgi:hypothetical protein